MTGGRRWALRCYPPVFRERYGAELDQLAADVSASNANLLWGAAQAWVRPVFAGSVAERRRRRLQATVGTVWVAWCAAFLVTQAMNRLLLDPPPADQPETVPTLLRAAEIAWLIGCGCAVWAALVMTVRAALPAFRSGRRSALRPLLAGGGAVLLEVALLVLVAILRGPAAASSLPMAFVLVGLAWLLGLVPTVLLVALGPVCMLGRLAPTETALRRTLGPAWGVVIALTVCCGLNLAAVAVAAPGPVAVVGTAYGLICALAALISAGRTVGLGVA